MPWFGRRRRFIKQCIYVIWMIRSYCLFNSITAFIGLYVVLSLETHLILHIAPLFTFSRVTFANVLKSALLQQALRQEWTSRCVIAAKNTFLILDAPPVVSPQQIHMYVSCLLCWAPRPVSSARNTTLTRMQLGDFEHYTQIYMVIYIHLW